MSKKKRAHHTSKKKCNTTSYNFGPRHNSFEGGADGDSSVEEMAGSGPHFLRWQQQLRRQHGPWSGALFLGWRIHFKSIIQSRQRILLLGERLCSTRQRIFILKQAAHFSFEGSEMDDDVQ